MIPINEVVKGAQRKNVATIAEELKQKLERFATLTRPLRDRFFTGPLGEFRAERDAIAVKLFDEIERLLALEHPERVFDALAHSNAARTGFNHLLHECVVAARLTPIKKEDGSLISDWVGKKYALVAISDGIDLVGYDATPGLEHLLSRALLSCLTSMFLNDNGFEHHGDIANRENLAYLKRAGFRLGENLFLGGARPKHVPTYTAIYVGAQGCHGNPHYIADLSSNARITTDALGNAFSLAFASVVAVQIGRRTKATYPVRESETPLGTMRMAYSKLLETLTRQTEINDARLAKLLTEMGLDIWDNVPK